MPEQPYEPPQVEDVETLADLTETPPGLTPASQLR